MTPCELRGLLQPVLTQQQQQQQQLYESLQHGLQTFLYQQQQLVLVLVLVLAGKEEVARE